MPRKSKEIKDILKHFNSIVKCNFWNVIPLKKVFDDNKQIILYEVSYKNKRLSRGFHKDILNGGQVFFSRDFVRERLIWNNFIRINCNLRKK